MALCLPLVLRRRYPRAVFAAITLVLLVQWLIDVQLGADLALLVSLYTVAAVSSRRWTAAAVGVAEVGAVLATLRWGDPVLPFFVGLSALVIASALLGISVQNRRALLASLQERAARLELERDQQGRVAAAAERARIAREMHDIVAHNLAVVIALADGAVFAARESPEQATAAMEKVSRTGREALAEMRLLLGVLNDESRELTGAAARHPGAASSWWRRCARRACRSSSRSRAIPPACPRASSWPPTGSCRRRSPTRSSTPGPRRPPTCACCA